MLLSSVLAKLRSALPSKGDVEQAFLRTKKQIGKAARVAARGRHAFKGWRRTRPFWGGVFLILGGIVILVPPYASLKLGDMVISIGTVAGVSSLLIGVMMVVIGIALWVRPAYRIVGGIAAGMLALVSLVTANLGGFLIGMVFGIIGAALMIAWTDQPKRSKQIEPSVEAT